MPDQPSSLDELCDFVGGVAGKQEPVPRLHLVGESHEREGVTAEGKCHPPTDDLWGLLHVIDGGNGKTPVGYWAPKVLLTSGRDLSFPVAPHFIPHHLLLRLFLYHVSLLPSLAV